MRNECPYCRSVKIREINDMFSGVVLLNWRNNKTTVKARCQCLACHRVWSIMERQKDGVTQVAKTRKRRL